ncbi:outer membrane protein [Bartonella sp. B35(2025)]
MNIKHLMATSFITLIPASVAQAADIVVPHEVAAPAVVIPAFSWTGFYFGGQVGHFSSKVEMSNFNKEVGVISKDKTPHPSGLVGGVYAGSNIDLGNNVILGIETDAVLAGREDTKIIFSNVLDANGAKNFNKQLAEVGIKLNDNDKFQVGDKVIGSFTYKEKWSGATRVRVGFSVVDYIIPYVAGGVAYAQMEGTSIVVGTKVRANAADLANVKTKVASAETDYDAVTMVGYTVGGGVDFAMTDNVVLRAEYRYSDFGKKKFKKDQVEFKYKTNDFRVGVAYKF